MRLASEESRIMLVTECGTAERVLAEVRMTSTY